MRSPRRCGRGSATSGTWGYSNAGSLVGASGCAPVDTPYDPQLKQEVLDPMEPLMIGGPPRERSQHP